MPRTHVLPELCFNPPRSSPASFVHFARNLFSQLHSILSDELARLNYDEIMGNSYEELDKSLEDNVISKVITCC